MSGQRACDLCGSTDRALLYEVNGYPIVRCESCGLVFVGRAQTADELRAFYDASYWEDAEGEGYHCYAAAEERKRHHFSGLLGDLEALTPGRDLIEVGSAYGYFLDEARRRGWRVRGIEPSRHAADHAREELGLEIGSEPLVALPLERDSVDCVAMWDVIEHLPDPRATLEAAFAWLRPGGVLGLSTGDVESLTARLHGRDWALMTPPWHQYYFSRRTMRRLLADVGFELVRIGGDGNIAVDAESSNPRVPGPIATLLESRPVSTVARKLGAGGIMFVFARKAAARR
jgi:SAM-dependent methyltransferase